jgi:hypothetical protein
MHSGIGPVPYPGETGVWQPDREEQVFGSDGTEKFHLISPGKVLEHSFQRPVVEGQFNKLEA